MKPNAPLIARKQVDLSPWRTGAGPMAIGVHGEGSIYAAAALTDEPLVDKRRGASFPKSKLTRPTRYRVVHWAEEVVQIIELPAEDLVAAFIQPTAAGVLLVGARCRWRSGGPEQNAVEYDWQGAVIRRFTMGDGIEDVRTTPDGSIWASYFDEGIFGNYGWNSPGPPGIGASGCVCFDATGQVRETYSPANARTDDICDAYAMNVVGDDDVWLYFYTQFPIVHRWRGRYTVWDYGKGGAHALATDGVRALLFGDYEQHDLARVVELGAKGRVTLVSEHRVVDEAGESITDARARGVGPLLYVFRGAEVLVVDDW